MFLVRYVNLSSGRFVERRVTESELYYLFIKDEVQILSKQTVKNYIRDDT